MNIGIFDSGLGGLHITHSLIQALPDYNYIYLGDTARVPYGNRDQDSIYEFTRQAVDYLFAQDCQLVIVACNTASSEALRRIQQEHLPAHYPDRKVLGVLIPAAEAAIRATQSHHIGVLATTSTVKSGAFGRELKKLDKNVVITSVPAPLLVPLVEHNDLDQAGPVLDKYLSQLPEIDTLILGCTHYPYMKAMIRQKLGDKVTVISQDEVLPPKLADYLSRHPEIADNLGHEASRTFLVTALGTHSRDMARQLFGEAIDLRQIELPSQSATTTV